VAERERVVGALREQGWAIPDQQANFVWFELGEDTPAFAAACDESGLTVRPYGHDGVRATIAEREANDRLVEVAGRFIERRSGG
jgi:histidinol-phosphate aminotransferase